MIIEAMKRAIDALNEAVAFREGGRKKAIDAITALRTAIQQAESEPVLPESSGHLRVIASLGAALRRLSFAAQTTGGTDGPDAELQSAIGQAEQALSLGGIGQAMFATTEPVAWMASYVDPIGNDHVYVTSHYDLAVENDMHGTPRPLVFGDTHLAPGVPDGHVLVPIEPTEEMLLAYTGGAITDAGFRWCRHQWSVMLAAAPAARPAPSVLKDDQIAALVNKVRDIARMFHDHQSLRERIAIELVPALKASQEVKSNAERWRCAIADGVNQSMNFIDIFGDWDGDGDFVEAFDAAMLAAK